jgi:predicted porin
VNRIAALLALALAQGTTVRAETSYAELKAGTVSENPLCVAGECAGHSTFLSGAFGYRVAPSISIEAVATSLGKTTRVVAGAPFELKTSAIGIAVAYEYAFSARFSAIVRGGGAQMTTDATPLNAGAAPSSPRDRRIRPTAGVQLAWSIGPTLNLSLSLDTWQVSSQEQSFRYQSLAGGLRVNF